MGERRRPPRDAAKERFWRKVIGGFDPGRQVRDAHGKRQYTGRFWNYFGDDEHPLSVFTYTPSRSRDGPGGPAEFLKDYRGYLQADAFAGYDALYLGPDARIVEVACWAHPRRKFFEARSSDRLRAETALAFVRELYRVERELREAFSSEAGRERSRHERLAEIVARRQAESRPVPAEFAAWIEQESPRLLPKHPLRQALEYARTNWAALVRYCDDGRLDVATWRPNGRFAASPSVAATGSSAVAIAAAAPPPSTSA
jgi:hypothetical protein